MSYNSIAINSKYPLTLTKFNIGKLILPNRVVFPPWQVNYANTDGTVSEKLVSFFTSFADNGCGLIITGCAAVSADTITFDRVMRVDSDASIPGLKTLFQEIEKRGSVPGIQLIHYGRQAISSVTGCELLAPSAIPCPLMSKLDPNYKVREMTLEDIQYIKQQFIDAALRAAHAGAKMIELHAAHGYLLNQFLSPYSNHRTDNYGGNLENRIRLLREIIEGIKQRLTQEVVISVRVSGNEFVEGGLVPADFKDIIPPLERAGMDLLHVSAGVYESEERMLPPISLGEAPHADIAGELKSYSSVPVCAAGSISSLETAESMIARGQTDLVAIGRSQVADPEFLAKSASGRESEIRKCIRDDKCKFWETGEPHMYCTVSSPPVNPINNNKTEDGDHKNQ